MEQDIPTPTDDPLVSVEDLALLWRTSADSIAGAVVSGLIPSLDGGHLVAAGRTDVPCIRRSWAEASRTDSPGAGRRIDGSGIHPAAQVALDLHDAISERNVGTTARLSSRASHSAYPDSAELLAAWVDLLGAISTSETAIATGVYALAPHPGVAVRITDRTGLTERYDQPTPMRMLGVVVLVEEVDGWKADVQESGPGHKWLAVTASAPPAGWSRDSGAMRPVAPAPPGRREV